MALIFRRHHHHHGLPAEGNRRKITILPTRKHKHINKYVCVEIIIYSFSFYPPSRARPLRIVYKCDRRRATGPCRNATETELGGAVRNEFPLLIIETIKTWPAAQWRMGGGRGRLAPPLFFPYRLACGQRRRLQWRRRRRPPPPPRRPAMAATVAKGLYRGSSSLLTHYPHAPFCTEAPDRCTGAVCDCTFFRLSFPVKPLRHSDCVTAVRVVQTNTVPISKLEFRM